MTVARKRKRCKELYRMKIINLAAQAERLMCCKVVSKRSRILRLGALFTSDSLIGGQNGLYIES